MYDILIVDDDLFALALLEEQLKGYGDFFTPVYASNGKEAVEILSQVEISLLVTDLIMPGDINGWHLIEYIENFHPNIPIVVITGCKDEEKVAALEGRVREILLKPIRVKQLVKIVTNILNEDIASGNLKGVSVGSFLQLLEMDEKTCLLEVGTSPKNKGLLYIHQGKLYDAEYGDLQEYEAACRLIAMDNVSFKIKALPKLEIRRRIKSELMSIIMDAMKLKDEVKQGESLELPPRDYSDDENKQRAFETDWRQSVKDDEDDEDELDELDTDSLHHTDDEPVIMPSPQQEQEPVTPKEDVFIPTMAVCSTTGCTSSLESLLKKLRSIKGYKGAGIMDFTGETIASDCLDAHIDIASIGAVFNDVFRSAQETAESLGVHTCTELVLKTNECIIILCGSGSESVVPFHLIAVLDKDGNQALTRMQLTKIVPLAARELN
ncbi:MAG: response regulator [Candidatus Electrothrix aestuarii]|uniref:Response regulator n=1 Tax=Candidatus Electrothrix aestuarii TaxID=3062594 RepID=A0AAU8LUQ2_9BACT|nr:response regulator [Candidatus Electrothrix aestuarii]